MSWLVSARVLPLARHGCNNGDITARTTVVSAGKETVVTGRQALGAGLAAVLTAGAAWVGISAAAADNQQAQGGGAQATAASDRVEYRGWPVRAVDAKAQATLQAQRAAAGRGNDTLALVTEQERFRFVDVGREGWSTGDFYFFEETVYNARGRRVIGEDTVRCEIGIRTFACEATFKLDGRGKIRIAGSLLSGRDNVFPVTGGTNNFIAVGGQMKAYSLSDNRSLLVFELVR